MTSSLGSKLISDYEYRQRVRKFKPSSLLPLIAADSCRYLTTDDVLRSPGRVHTPWGLADAARVALSCGTEHNRADPAEGDLHAILRAYDAFNEPALRSEDLRSLLLRMASQQFRWQLDDFAGMARTIAVLSQTSPIQELECMNAGWDIDLFGFSLLDYIGTVHLVYAAVLSLGGRFSSTIFDGKDGVRIAQHVGRATALSMIDTHFTTDKATFRTEDPPTRPGGGYSELRRYTFNPLRDRPLLTGFGSGYLCPSPRLALDKASLGSLYYAGLRHFNLPFTRDLGHLFEQYVGRQLRVLSDAQVLPEITYKLKAKGSDLRSVDWLVVFDDLVLLVEVKSTIPTEPIRLGTPDADQIVLSKLTKACHQIDKTAELIKNRHPSFTDVPCDRPILGMAVTLEPFYLANASNLGRFLPDTQTSVCVVSAAEIERMVTIEDAPVSGLLLERDACTDRSTWDLSPSLEHHNHRRNPVLDLAWDASPWSAAQRPAQ